MSVPAIAVKIKFGGRIRHMLYDLNAWAYIEDKTGFAINDRLLWENISFNRVIIFLKAAFLHETPQLSLKEVGNSFDAAGLSIITEAIKTAMQRQTADQAASPLA